MENVSLTIKLERYAHTGFTKRENRDGAVMSFSIDVPRKQVAAVKRFFGGKSHVGLYAVKSVK